MMTFWLIQMFVSLTMLIYGILTLRSLRRDPETPVE
jgi:hypothetical protein